MTARINAGHLASGHWVANREESGGRIVGEVCHFVDLLSFWAGAPPVRVTAHAVAKSGGFDRADNVVLGFDFADGSVGTIAYTSMGDTAVAKEQYEVFGEGRVAQLEDFRRLSIIAKGRAHSKKALRADKGHAEELRQFIEACADGKPSPIAWDSIEATTRATIAADFAWQNRVGVELT